MDENNKNNKGIFSLFGKNKKQKLKRKIILSVLLPFGGLGFFLAFMILITFVISIPILHLFMSDKATNDNYSVDVAYQTYVASPCVEENKRCSDRQKANYSKLKKSEEKFLKKLDKVSKKYNLSNEQKYIILTTIFYGNDENFFYEKSDPGSADFTLTSGAYVLDEDDEAVAEEGGGVNGDVYVQEKDTIKELAKQFSYYPVNCSYTVTKVVDGQTITEQVVEELNNNGQTFTFGFWEHLLKKTDEEGFDEAKEACLAKENGEITSGSKKVGAEGGEAGINKYYKYLETTSFFDNKDILKRTFYDPYFKAKDLKEWSDEDLVEVRKDITDSIQKIVEAKLYLDQKYNISDNCGPNGLANMGNNTSYWWPLADKEANGFAASESTNFRISSGFGPRRAPCSGCSSNHGGVDLAAPSGTPIIASMGGTVTIAKPSSSAGNYVGILDANGNLLKYMHMTKYIVSVGDVVKQGQVIGYVGSTGHSTGPHLHFQFELGGSTKVNPLDYVSESNQRPGMTTVNNLDNNINSNAIQTTNVSNNYLEEFSKSVNPIKLSLNQNIPTATFLADDNISGNTIDVSQLKKETTQEKNFQPVGDDVIAAYNGTTDIWTNVSDAILKAAGVDRQGNRIEGGVTYHEYRKCQRYIGLVYEKAGLGYQSHGTAYLAATHELVSKSMSVIPVGASIWGTSSSSDGHAGIYIGNGKVIHNTGSKYPQPIVSLKDWAQKFHYIGWGWTSGADKVTSATASAPISNSSLTSSVSGTECLTTNGDGSVLVGNDIQQTICLTFKNNNYSDNAIAGILGNVERESSFKPENTNPIGCIGLFQFCPKGEKPAYMSKYGDSWADPTNQIEFILEKLETDSLDKRARDYMMANPNASVQDMAFTFCKYYERPEAGECNKRRAYGDKYLSYVQNNCGGASNIQTVNNKTFNSQTITKKIFVGDSRTVGMKNTVKTNDIWSAENNKNYSWMVSTGIPNIENQITPGTALIILMGVNDLDNVNKYADYINGHANGWIAKGASVYFVSVNPVVDSQSRYAKNANIITFNNTMKSKLNSNIGYIDTYSRLQSNFKTIDGVHYDNNTYKNIYNMISSAIASSNVSAGSVQNVSQSGQTNQNGHKIEQINGITYIDNIMIVNKTYSIPATYVPTNTHQAVGSQPNCPNCLVEEVYNAYTKLKEGAKAAGVSESEMQIVSGYRSYNYQNNLWTKRKNSNGLAYADRGTARAGHSEHQTGYAFDIGEVTDEYANKPGGKFIQNNAYKYGFILRYPKGKEASTGFKYESWHIRYVGVNLATKLYNNGNWITLEEYFGIDSKYQS